MAKLDKEYTKNKARKIFEGLCVPWLGENQQSKAYGQNCGHCVGGTGWGLGNLSYSAGLQGAEIKQHSLIWKTNKRK